MYSYDMISGESSYDGSPSSPPQNLLSEQEIANNANMRFDLDPNMRYQQMQQQQQYYGYNNPYNPQPYYYQQTFDNQPSGFSGYAGNPAYQYIQNNIPQYNPPVQDEVYFVKGYNPSNTKLLLPANAKEMCDQLQMQMNDEMEEDYEKRLNHQYSYCQSVNVNPNYYGSPYVQPYNPSIYNKYYHQAEEIRREAEQNRINLNKHLSRLCHNYLGDDVSDEDIDMIYDGYTVTVPGTHAEDKRKYDMLANAVPIDTSIPYKQHTAQLKEESRKYLSDDMDMQTFFKALGQVRVADMLEEERHRRRDLSSISMSTSTYRELIRRKKVNDSQEQSFKLPDMNAPGNNIPFGQMFPTLNESARLLDDGTLSIHAPDWLGNKEFAITNVNEDEYEAHRRDFVNSIYGSENPRIGGVANGG